MAEPALSARGALRVSELTRYLKDLFARDDVLGALSVRGEVSECSIAASGHVYFGLKDSESQIACVLFRREASRQGDQVKDLRRGVSVVVHGFLTLYEPRGTYQIYVEEVRVEGQGPLFQRAERLKQQLEREGLFASDRKRALPPAPRTIALITSPGSQAYHDVLHRLGTQYPFVRVIEAGASVQGASAADEMSMAIDIVNRLTDAEIILLVRGGGAPEELAAFNEERLVRAIYSSRVPVITGIGHETDETIADLVADRRAATPSLAAAECVPDLAALTQKSLALHRGMTQSMKRLLQSDRTRWGRANQTLIRVSPQARIAQAQRQSQRLEIALHRAHGAQLRARRERLNALRRQLQALDPMAILQRGYAVLIDPETNQVISQVDCAIPGKSLVARVSDGQFLVRVEDA